MRKSTQHIQSPDFTGIPHFSHDQPCEKSCFTNEMCDAFSANVSACLHLGFTTDVDEQLIEPGMTLLGETSLPRSSRSFLYSHFHTGRCTTHAPYQSNNGHYCCVHEVNGGVEDTCRPLSPEDFVPCPSPPCKSTKHVLALPPATVPCPLAFPISHHRGQFCCKNVRSSQPDCLEGRIDDETANGCCGPESDFTRCPGRKCEDNSEPSFCFIIALVSMSWRSTFAENKSDFVMLGYLRRWIYSDILFF